MAIFFKETYLFILIILVFFYFCCFRFFINTLVFSQSLFFVNRFFMRRETPFSFCKNKKIFLSAISFRASIFIPKSIFLFSQHFSSSFSPHLSLTSPTALAYGRTCAPQNPSWSFNTPCRFFSSTQTVFLQNCRTERFSRDGTPAKCSDSSDSPSISRSLGRGNFFSFFGFPEDPELDESELQSRYHAVQKYVHPDQRCQQETQGNKDDIPKCSSNFVSSLFDSYPFQKMNPAHHSAVMDSISVYANEGYALLKDPFLRSRYLCKLQSAREEKKKKAANEKGCSTLSTEEEEMLIVDTDNIVRDSCIKNLDEVFLMELMEMNELIFAGDPSQKEDHDRMEILRRDLEERVELIFDLTKKAWRDNNFEDFVACIHKWTYLWNALNNLLNRM